MTRRASRRRFLGQSAIASVGFWTATGARAQSDAPSEKLNIAMIGCGGKGAANLSGVKGQNIVALCDADERMAGGARDKYPQAKFFRDFRKMLDDQKDIDAVVVSTPDHTHAVASVMAMKLGKHVYCEKPLTHSVYEARVMRETAPRYKVATQMGNQGTASSGLRRGVEVVQSGAIGPIREVHVWTNRPIWPQGQSRPKDAPPAPSQLDWDAWVGPAPMRPYNPAYLPFKWRGWWDFGTGALGDMACHTANLPFMALKLAYPTSIEAESAEVNSESPPKWSIIRYDFPARDALPPVRLTWYDGGKLPPPELMAKVLPKPKSGDSPARLPSSGALLVGEKGIMFALTDYGGDHKLFPEEAFAGYKAPEPVLPRTTSHYQEWIDAAKGGPAAMSHFDYAALLTETVLLGNVAVRAGRKIVWDAAAMKAVGCPEADQYLKPEYRQGWML
jgi:hypothetical protein